MDVPLTHKGTRKKAGRLGFASLLRRPRAKDVRGVRASGSGQEIRHMTPAVG